jgi:hypothetical protein
MRDEAGEEDVREEGREERVWGSRWRVMFLRRRAWAREGQMVERRDSWMRRVSRALQAAG